MIQIPDFFTIRQRTTLQNESFNELALEVFRYQYQQNHWYRKFCDLSNKSSEKVLYYTDIPFLPVSFFKQQPVCCFEPVWAERIYTSSGTTGSNTSRHYVRKYADYKMSFETAFHQFYGDPKDYCILALLPGYLEREGSSLIEMAQELIKASQHPKSGFYLNNYRDLIHTVNQLQQKGQKTLLLGVTYALLDLAEMGPFNWPDLIVMETGGMKGKRREMIREELHEQLKTGLGVSAIHSEYGMTELLSQAYSQGNGIFNCPPWMKILTRDTYDPLTLRVDGKTGGVNIIDLANIDSCSFIATQDLGRLHPDGSFEIMGRFDNSDIRGCNLMVG